MLFLVLSLFLTLLLTASPLFYALLLVLFSSTVVFNLTLLSLLPSPIGLLILLVYLGAVIILLAYVCAVVPNLSLTTPSFVTILTFIFIMFIIVSLSFLTYESPASSILQFNLTDYFYTPFGSGLFFLVCLIILLVLFVSSTTTQVSSPVRGI